MPDMSPSSTSGLRGELRIADLEVGQSYTAGSRSIVPAGQPIEVLLALDCSEMITPDEALLYTAAIYAKSLAGGSRQPIGESHGTLAPASHVSITLEGQTPPQGIYRLEATVTLEAAQQGPGSNLVAFLEGRLLQVC
jgi:hypothetical protein